ncbi:MAG TPA: ATP-binding protein [Kofleriaceae bacterium]|nr:ATP-binding protein [Kofleriaceae bacterium]
MGGADPDPPTGHEAAGRTLGGRFRAIELLERAAGVETWRGVDNEDRAVVIKTLPAASVSDAARAWLDFQASVLSRIERPEVAGALPLWSGIDGETFFLVRRFVAGRTLKEHLTAGPLAAGDAVALAVRLLAALEEVHAGGLVHGDIKPSNIALAGDSLLSPVLVDFGLARHALLAAALELGELTPGSIAYLAPEQSGVIERGVDRRADLHAVGLLLFEAVSGRVPFDGQSVAEILRRHLTASPPPLNGLVAGAPRALDRIVTRLLRRDPRDRYQTARGARADLEALAAELARGHAEPELVVGSHDARDSLTEPAFTGRGDELAALEGALAEARAGRGGAALLEGESGAGKTWLLEELARRVSGLPVWVLRGHGLAQVAHQPFQVLSGVAREIAASASSSRAARLVERTGAAGRAIAESLPALERLLGAPDQSPPEQPRQEERSTAALSELLDALGSAEEAALLLIDDAQWADAPTLRLLERWHARAAGSHTLVVLALRSEEAGGAHPARIARPMVHVQLGRLGPDEVREQVASMAGQLPAGAADLIVEHAAGNPFVVSAMLHGMVETGALVHRAGGWQLAEEAPRDGAPGGLRLSNRRADLIAARISRLRAPSRRLLAVGALLGRSFDAALAAELAGIEPAEAVRAIQELRGALIWIDAAGSRCTFPHDRIREALLEQLPEPERRALHLQAAQRLEARGRDGDFDLAYHYDAAGEPARALPHALRAAERAQAQHDMELAERHYRIAERGLGDRDGADPALRFRLARGLGDVLMVRSVYEECATWLDEALELAPDAAARADIEERRTQLALKKGDLAVAAQHGERALRLIGRPVPTRTWMCALIVVWQALVQLLHTRFARFFVGRRPPERAGEDLFAIRIYHGLTAPYFFARGAVWSLWAHLTDLNLCERYGPSAALGRAYGLHGAIFSGLPRFFERAVRYARRGATLCRERGDVWGEARATQFLAGGLCTTGHYREAVDAAEESARLFERAGDTWEGSGALCWGALARYREGDLGGALRAAQQLFARAHALDDAHGIAFAVDVWARATDGRVPADVLRSELDRRADHVQTTSLVAQAEAIRLLAAGEAAAAEALIDVWLERMRSQGALIQEPNVSLLLYRVAALRRQAEEVPAANPRRRAALVARARRAGRRAIKAARRFRNSEPHALREAALVAAMADRPEHALALADRSVQAAERLGAAYELALSREARGQIGAALERPGAAEELERARGELQALRAAVADETAASARITVSLVERFRSVLAAGHQIARSLAAEAVFESLRAGALALLPAQRCSILEPVGAAAHTGEAHVVHGDSDPISPDLVREALESGRLVVRPTDELPIAADAQLSRAGVRSAMCAPVFARGRVAALLHATHGEVDDAFGGEEAQQIAEFLTALAGAALENAHGFLRVQQFSRELEERVGSRTAELGRANAELAESLQRLQQTQQQLLHAGRMAAVGTLIAGLSHELNNPLTVILGNVENLIRLMPEDEQQRRLAEAIERQARRAGKLVGALLRFSRTQSEKREEVEPGALIRTVAELVGAEARRRDVELRVSIPDQLPAVWMAQPDIESALVNIVTNALQATPRRGRVEISAAAEERAGRAGLLFAVQDTGTGIGLEILPLIFDPFFTTKPPGQGTGLGLSLAREAVAAHDGQLEAESEPGRGATLRLWLPLGPAA